MINESCRREYNMIRELTNLIIPRDGILMFSYNNRRVSIESDTKTISVYVLGRGILATAMPDYEKNYEISSEDKDIISDLENYFINEKIIKK